jgi:hypothetical protein
MALPSGDKLEPNHASWSAVEQRPEHENSVCNKSRCDGSPCAEEHDSVGAATRCEQFQVLEKNGHLDEETQRTVDDLGCVCPLCKSMTTPVHMGRVLT